MESLGIANFIRIGARMITAVAAGNKKTFTKGHSKRLTGKNIMIFEGGAR